MCIIYVTQKETIIYVFMCVHENIFFIVVILIYTYTYIYSQIREKSWNFFNILLIKRL